MPDTDKRTNTPDAQFSLEGQTVSYQWKGEDSFETVLFEALDSIRGIEMPDDTSIKSEINIDAIREFISNSRSDNVYAVFGYENYYVEVQGRGTIIVSAAQSPD